MKNKYYLLLILFNAFCFNANAQNFEWLQSYGSSKNSDGLSGITNPNDSTCTFLLNTSFNSLKNVSDTLRINLFKSYVAPHAKGNGTYIVSLNKNGKLISLKKIGNFEAIDICSDNTNYYVYGVLKDSTVIVDTTNLDIKKGMCVYLMLDKNFNVKWISQFGNYNSIINYGSSTSGSNKSICIINNKVFFCFPATGLNTVGDSIYSLGNNKTFIIGQLDPITGKSIWSNVFYNAKKNAVSFYYTSISYYNNYIYVSGYVNSGIGEIILSNDTFKNGSFILKLDSLGRYVKRILFSSIKSSNPIPRIHSAVNANFGLVVVGQFVDSCNFGNTIIAPNYPTNSNKGEMYVALLDYNLYINWFYKPVNANGTSMSNGFLQRAVISNDFIYVSGILGGTIVIDSRTLTPTNSQKPNDILVLKMDFRGNVLWGVNGGAEGYTYGMVANKNDAIYLGGQFLDSLKFGNNKLFSGVKNTWEAWSLKLSDNAIIRGQVKAGPYCAGDTLRIPYRKIGDYDTSNVFIAELSDADGNFTGAHRQLGRLKSNKDSVILARLPLFQVGSSEKYRIRILSTAPAVQSYYKVDTLRLLIYSKDKAYAGNDTTICKGDSVNLQTYGGTKWRWSPSYKIKDSTARQTPAWPDKTTRYKIIIADSSGCGMADTAYKTIVVRKEPSIQFHTPKDTSVCIGGSMPLIASFHGGDSTGYIWQWASIDSKSNYSFVHASSGKLSDTLLYTMPVNELDSMRFVLYLNDDCTPKTAFYNYTLKVKKQKSRARFNGSDTLVCPGKAIGIVAGFDAGNYSLYSWTWQEQNLSGSWNNRRFGSNKGADTFMYTLSPLWQGKKKLRVLLKDQCTGLSDTAVYSLIPRDTLSLSLNNRDTILCQGSQYVFKVKAKGGNPSTYQYRWINLSNQDTLSLRDSLLYKPKTSTALMVEVSDGCMQRSIQKTIQVDMFPVLSTGIFSQSKKAKDSTLCHGQVLKVYAQSSGGKGSGYNYLWKYNGVNIGQKDSMAFTPSNSAVLELISSDGCSVNDSTSININVLPKLESKIKTQDSLCFPSTLKLKALAQGGKGNYSYQWLSSSNVLLGTKDSLQINYNDSNQKGLRAYKLILQDGCSSNDSTKISLHLLPGLSLALKTQDTCISSSTVLTAITSGGKANKHQITWFKNGVFLGLGPSNSLNIAAQSARYTAVLNDGCSKASDTVNIRVYTKAQVSIQVSNPCYGDTSVLKARLLSNNPISNYNWRIDNTTTSTIDSVLKLKFNNIGWHTIVLKAGTGQCVGKDSIRFNIIDKPKAAFDFTHLPNTNAGIPFQFNDRSLLANSWAWTFGTYGQANIKNPKFTFPDSGFMRIKLRVGKQNLCFDSTEQVIPIYERFEFFFPNAISIDGNGINDAFGLNPGQYPFVKTYQLKIFNRWGEKVFDSDVKEETFSSTRALQDVYIYKAIIKDIYNITHSIEGTLTVLK